MNENKTVIVIDDGTSKVLEVKEKKMPDTSVVAVKETYVVIKLGEDEFVSEKDVLDVLRDNLIQYRIVEVVSEKE